LLKRLHHGIGDLPGTDGQDYTVKILGPFIEALNGKPALRYLDSASKATMESFCCPDFRVTTWARCIDPLVD
jgi:hypothetical protein